MALIIDQQPPDYSPAYNQQPWVIRETNVTDADLPNWRLAVSILRDGAIGDPISTHILRFRFGEGGRAVFDPQRSVEGDLTFDHGPRPYALTPWATAEGSIMTYSLLIAAQYFNGAQWVSKSVLATEGKFVYNATFDPLAFVTYSQADHLLNQLGVPCLTDAPTAQNIGSNDSLWLHTLTDTANAPVSMTVRTYNYTGGLLNTYTYANAFTTWSGAVVVGGQVIPSVINKRRRLRVAVGPRDLAAMTSPVSFAGVGSYTVTFTGISISPITVGLTYTFTITDCAKYTPTRLHWLNRMGGFDAYTFKLKSVKERKAEKSTYGRQPNVLSAGRYGYSVQSRGTATYHTEVEKMLTLNSDHLTDTEADWLQNLYMSPMVFIENSNGTFTAVTVENKEYQIKEAQQDGIPYAEVKLTYALKDGRQRG
jgi:hypothetical protein